MDIRNQFLYNPTLNHAANWPILSTFIGLARIIVHLASLAKSLFLLITSQKPYYYGQVLIDLKAILRGVIELPPVLGGIGSWYIDHFHLSPAQKLAYRVQEIYDKNLKDKDEWIKEEKDLVEIDPTKPPYNDPEFLDFINHERVKISNDESKIETFCEYFKKGESHEIFNDRKLPFYALGALVRKKIDKEDMATILNLYSAKQCFPDLQVYTLYDQAGNITHQGERLIKVLMKKEDTWLGKGNPGTKDELLEKLKKLPRHKQIFWHHEALLTADKINTLKKESPVSFFELFYSPVGSLYAALVEKGGFWFDGDQELGLPFSIERIFFNQKYSKTNNPFNPKLGKFSAKEITKDVEEQSRRLCATFFPGINNGVSIHNSLELPTTIVGHDKSHAHILQAYPDQFLDFIKEVRQDFRALTGFEISKETWEHIELVAPDLDFTKSPAYVLKNFASNHNGRVDELSISELFWIPNDKHPEPTVLFWMMFIKIAENRNPPFHDLTNHWMNEDQTFIEAKKKLFRPGDSLQQKIWKLQEMWNVRFKGKKKITKVSDDKLKFVKIPDGRRKNTVILKEVI